MIDKESLRGFMEDRLDGTDYYLIDVYEEPGDRYVVEIDSDSGVDVDTCAALSRDVEERFPRDDEREDYELEIGSAGLTSPFKVRRQYDKNVGQEIEVLTVDGRKLHGILVSAGDTGFVIRTESKERVEGSKRKEIVVREEEIPYGGAKMVRLDLHF